MTMKTKTLKTCTTVSFMLCLWGWIGFIPPVVYGQAPTVLPFKIQAEHQEITEDRIVASGNIEISWKEYRIYADYMEYNPKTREIIARGRVTMSSHQTVLSGEKLRFSLKDRTGVMYDVFGQSPPAVRYKTDKLTQVDNETLSFNNIEFTSCAQCVPRWKITCSKGKIKKEKYIEMSHAVLKIKKIPIFYIPYVRYPLDKTGRATGLLFPNIGSSSWRGFFIQNSFFWDIRDNIDLTLYLDYYAKAGIGMAEEFRYLFKGMDGNIKFYFFKYKKDNILETTSTSDYYLKMTHKQKINFLNTRIIVNIDRQSDANFLRLFSNDFYSVLSRTSRSSVSINSSISNMKFSINAAQHDTYYTFNNQARTLRYLPQFIFNLNQQKIWKLPGYFSLGMSYSSLTRQGKSYEEDETIYFTDISTQRLNIQPSFSVNLVQAPWLWANLTLSSKHSIYPKSLDPETKEETDKSLHLHYQTARVDLKGPIFFKIFRFRSSKLKHLVIPGITIRYVTKVDPEERARLMPVDNFDYPSYSFVGFSLTNRLLHKGNEDKSAQEILSYTISQDYYFDPEAAHRGRKINGMFPEFSELKNTLRIRPFKFFNVDASVILSHYLEADTFLDRFTRLRVNIAYNNRNSFLYGNFYYNRFINQYAKKDHIFNRDTIGGRLRFDIRNFPIKLDSFVNYDITAKEFRNATFKFSYDYQCITFHSELQLFKYGGRIETQFNVGFSLGNLGTVKDFLGIER
ncbi:MAG: LPS export ABC transporter periplasmic protein LptC [Candidatus Aminicenantes bacterium]|nr:LPS export ABC transporter periplasmic protein LptC [Candidatus Aminicenantes bacterium]NIO83983.1 LPS export ABC transporter periplasmic protein LptC [Candidatus Aminicenantes bacterium]NIT25975.1 LPS export ABC transporter periplasmic protein LptC [Candidatus Aminicenantes bacterium]